MKDYHCKEIVDDRGDGYTGPKAACSCGMPARFVGLRERQIVTMSGVQILQRACYHCQSCHRVFSPLETKLGLIDQGCSRRVLSMSVRFCSFLPFQLAARELEAICAVRLAPSTLERYCQYVGDNIKSDWARKEELLWQDKLPVCEHRPKAIQVSMDGTMIYVGKEWREAKLAVVYERKGEKIDRARYYATLAQSTSFGRKVRTLAHVGGSGRCARIGVVADGWHIASGVME